MATPTSRDTKVRDALGFVLIGAFVFAMFLLFGVAIPEKNEQLITYMLGQLSGFVAAVVALHYVTKAGEREAEAMRTENTGKALDAIAAAQASTPPPAGDDALRDGDTVTLTGTENER